MSATPSTLQEWTEVIKQERRFVDKKPYSHNIISLTLAMIAKEYGEEEANAVIRKCRLKALGWSEKVQPKKTQGVKHD